MIKIALRGVRYNSGRYIATLIAIITGVAFFTSAGFMSDRVIDALEGDVNRQFAGVDAAIVADDDGAGSEFADQLRISNETAQQIAALPEVDAVAGDLSAPIAFLGADGTPFADGATGRLWIADDELNPVDVEEGAAPTAAGEIAVDQGLAEDEGLAVGDQVVVLTAAGQFDATIVGITSFGSTDAIDQNGTVSVPEATAFDWLNAGKAEYVDLYIRGNVDEPSLVAAVEPLVPDGFKVQTGDEFLAGQAGRGERLRQVPQDRLAGVRHAGAVRRRVRHLQHVQRHREAAPPGVGRPRGNRGNAEADQALAARRRPRHRAARVVARCGCGVPARVPAGRPSSPRSGSAFRAAASR